MTLAVKHETSTRSGLSAVACRTPGAENPSHLAHDARNWLMALQMYCDLLRTLDGMAGDGKKWIEELSGAVERGYGLVDLLLECTESSVPPQQYSPEAVPSPPPLELAAAIENRLPLLCQMAGSHIRVEIKTVAQPGPIALRELEFERILMNLARNAMEAMPQGGRLRITLESHSSSRRSSQLCRCPSMVLRVSDTGSGISADLLPHIFDSGVSTKIASGEAVPSHGFGLAIVRELTLGAGGSIQVRSRQGHGTSFAIELPLLKLPPLSHPNVPVSRSRLRGSRAVSEIPKRKKNH